MSITYAQCKAAIRRAIGGDPTGSDAAYVPGSGSGSAADPDAELTFQLIINDAGRFLVSMRSWLWLRRTATLNLTQGQNYIALPSDFGRLMGVRATSGTRSVVVVRPNEIYELRRTGYSSSVTHLRCTVTQSYPSAGGQPEHRLDLDHTPTASATGAIQMEYLADWSAVSPTVAPKIPTFMEPLFFELLRAHAVGWMNTGTRTLSDLLGEIRAGVLYRSATTNDGEEQSEQGMILDPIGRRTTGAVQFVHVEGPPP